MRHAIPLLTLVTTVLCGPVATASAEDYQIKLVRPVKIGERYALVARGTQEQHMTITVAGQRTPPKDEMMSIALTAKAVVLVVSAGGSEMKTRFTVTRLTNTAGARAAEVLPAGTIVIAERVGSKTAFQVAGAPATHDVAQALGVVISLDSDGGANDDTVLGTKERKKVGDSWQIDAAAAAADARTRSQLQVDAANITGKATLADVLKDGLKVTAVIEMKHVGIPLPPGVTVKSSVFSAHFSGVFPVDATRRATQTVMTLDGAVECIGKVDGKDLALVLTQKNTRTITFTTP